MPQKKSVSGEKVTNYFVKKSCISCLEDYWMKTLFSKFGTRKFNSLLRNWNLWHGDKEEYMYCSAGIYKFYFEFKKIQQIVNLIFLTSWTISASTAPPSLQTSPLVQPQMLQVSWACWSCQSQAVSPSLWLGSGYLSLGMEKKYYVEWFLQFPKLVLMILISSSENHWMNPIMKAVLWLEQFCQNLLLQSQKKVSLI